MVYCTNLRCLIKRGIEKSNCFPPCLVQGEKRKTEKTINKNIFLWIFFILRNNILRILIIDIQK